MGKFNSVSLLSLHGGKHLNLLRKGNDDRFVVFTAYTHTADRQDVLRIDFLLGRSSKPPLTRGWPDGLARSPREHISRCVKNEAN